MPKAPIMTPDYKQTQKPEPSLKALLSLQRRSVKGNGSSSVPSYYALCLLVSSRQLDPMQVPLVQEHMSSSKARSSSWGSCTPGFIAQPWGCSQAASPALESDPGFNIHSNIWSRASITRKAVRSAKKSRFQRINTYKFTQSGFRQPIIFQRCCCIFFCLFSSITDVITSK